MTRQLTQNWNPQASLNMPETAAEECGFVIEFFSSSLRCAVELLRMPFVVMNIKMLKLKVVIVPDIVIDLSPLAPAAARSLPSWMCWCRRRAAAGRTLCWSFVVLARSGLMRLWGSLDSGSTHRRTELPERTEKEVELWVSMCRKWQRSRSRRGCTYNCAGRSQARRSRG